MYLSGMLLFLLVIGCNAANETSRFLSGNGFEHLVALFSDQEIKVRQIPAQPDQDLFTSLEEGYHDQTSLEEAKSYRQFQ